MNRIPDTIKSLIIINVIVFIGTFVLKMNISDSLALYYPTNPNFGYWQFITHLFVHGSVMHILFNMYALWAFGSPLEMMWGRKRFLFFYFSAGIGAGLIYSLANYFEFNSVYEKLVNIGLSATEIQHILDTGTYSNQLIESISEKDLFTFYSTYHTPAVGASGAIYGILVAFGIAFPDAKLAMIFFPVPIAAKYFIPLIILSDLFFGLTSYSVGNIAHFAHIGGALIGFIIAFYWKKNQFNRWN